MAGLLEATKKVKWNDDLRALYKRFPSMVRSKEWPRIISLAISGDIDTAWEIATNAEKTNFDYRVHNTISRSLRVKRVALFKLHKQAARDLAAIFAAVGDSLVTQIENRADSPAKFAGLSKEIDRSASELRVEIRKWLSATLRTSTLLALKNAGETFDPILKDMVNVSKEAVEQNEIDLRLLEEPLNFPTKGTRALKGKVNLWSQKWKDVRGKIVKTITKSAILGVPAEQRVVDIARQAATQMKRIVANNIARGVAPAKTAREIKKFLSPAIVSAIKGDDPLPRGVYRSVYKNAMRLARTESNRAYTHAGAKWAMDKSFITGVRINLSPMHSETDECDDLAAKGVISPEEAMDLIPAHPHCMCYLTYEIKDRFLDKEAA